MTNLKVKVIKKLNERGITIDDIAPITYELQKNYQDITIDDCKEVISSVLDEKEVQYAILTGIAIDEAAEKQLFDKDVNDIITSDTINYGLDEILALSIINKFGSIALTNFGHIDKVKPYIIGRMDQLGKKTKLCTTFLDDLIAAIAAASASQIANKK
ncbi:MAG: phosphatidylglycerophosphatase A [Bacilli bacterium]